MVRPPRVPLPAPSRGKIQIMTATTAARSLEVHLIGPSPEHPVGTIMQMRADGFVAEFGDGNAPVLLPGQAVRIRICNAGLGGLANAFDARGAVESREQRGKSLLYGIEVADPGSFARSLHALTDSTDDRRAHSRVPFDGGENASAIMHHARLPAWVRATILDLSEAGIGVTCSDTFSTMFRVGDPIKLTFRMPGRGAPLTMAGTIRGRVAFDRRVRFGIQFGDPTTAAELAGMRMIGEYVARHLRMLRGIT